MMHRDPKQIVRDGYDLVSHAYRSDDFVYERSEYRKLLSWLGPLLPPGSRVLDVGCGCGIPIARELARDHQIVGVDISPVQIARGRQLVPNADFRCESITNSDFAPGSFAAIVAFYAIIHIPLAEQEALLDAFVRWLAPGGFVLLTVGSKAWTGIEHDWQGVQGATMYWSHTHVGTYREWLVARRLTVLEEGFHAEGNAGHHVFLAQAPATSAA